MDVAAVVPVEYVVTGHRRQRPVHLYLAKVHGGDHVSLIGVVDPTRNVLDDAAPLLRDIDAFSRVRFVTLPDAADAAQLRVSALGDAATAVNAVCYGNPGAEVARVASALVDFVPMLRPLCDPMEIPRTDAVGLTPSADDASALHVKCCCVKSGDAALNFRESYDSSSIALSERVLADVLALQAARRVSIL
jgi:hypothetical protein